MSRQARQRRRRHSGSGATRAVLLTAGIAIAGLLIAAVAAVAYVVSVLNETPKLASLHAELSRGSSQVFAADGTRLGYIQSDELRSPIGFSEIPADLRNATVAIEDQRFYRHGGIDVTGLFRSAVKDVTSGAALQGGSTLEMQLVRNLYLGNDNRTVRQKIEEAKLAEEYAEHHSKREILTNYLNSVPYGTVGGQTAIGVQAAARIFFDKPASQLNLAQAALLAGLPQAPSQYNPFSDADAARERRNAVLSKMAELHYVSPAQASAAKASPLQVKLGDYYSQRRESFFFQYVRQQLIDRYGKRSVEQGGLKVYTTIDLRMQGLARKAIAEVLNEQGDPAAAIVTINPQNGDIEAMAESQSYSQSQFNLAADGHRQPGSTFKAIDLADALSRGIDPNSTYYTSKELSEGWLPAYPTYSVKTFDGTYAGSISLVQATLKSDNTVYAQLAADLGEDTITHMAYQMGVKTHLSSLAAEALGGLTYGVTPLEMAVVYATLADGGWRNSPIAITKVVFPDGHVDSNWGTPHRVKVLSQPVTGEETSILHQNVLGGTAVRSAINCPTAAKTGTTSELVDAWLDGYNSEFSTVVWMGYPNKRVPMTDVHGEAQQGGALPAVIWHDYMSAATEGKPCAPLNTSSEGISYKPFYGKYATTGEVAEPEPYSVEIAPRRKGPAPHAHRAPRERAPIEVQEAPAAPPAKEPGPPEGHAPGPSGGPPGRGVGRTGGAGSG
jgi:penicillin-binding protein 1A